MHVGPIIIFRFIFLIEKNRIRSRDMSIFFSKWRKCKWVGDLLRKHCDGKCVLLGAH